MRVRIVVDGDQLGDVSVEESYPFHTVGDGDDRRILSGLLTESLKKITRAYGIEKDWSL